MLVGPAADLGRRRAARAAAAAARRRSGGGPADAGRVPRAPARRDRQPAVGRAEALARRAGDPHPAGRPDYGRCHGYRADRRRRAERLLRGRLAGRRRRHGRRSCRQRAPGGGRLRPCRRHPRPPHRPGRALRRAARLRRLVAGALRGRHRRRGAASRPGHRRGIEAVFDKGEYAAAYSGFEGSADGIGLAAWLRSHDVDAVEVVGIATDHCVRATALDAAAQGFATTVRLDLTAGVAAATVEAALDAAARRPGSRSSASRSSAAEPSPAHRVRARVLARLSISSRGMPRMNSTESRYGKLSDASAAARSAALALNAMPRPGRLQHVDVVGAVADRDRLAQRHVELAGEAAQRLGLAGAVDDRPEHPAGDPAVDDLQLVRGGELQAELG